MPPSVVGALVINCSGFCPASTLTSITANRYRIHADDMTSNLSSMCCGASSIGVDNTTGVLRAHCMSTVVHSYRMPPLTSREKMQTICPIDSFIFYT
jgi:3-ketoacyl-CoA synthase